MITPETSKQKIPFFTNRFNKSRFHSPEKRVLDYLRRRWREELKKGLSFDEWCMMDKKNNEI